MQNDKRLDDELANFTDHLLAGEDLPVSSELEDLALVVRQLHRTVTPGAQAETEYRAHLKQRLQREWTIHHERQRRGWQNRRVMQLMAAGVAAVVLLVILLSQNIDHDGGSQGTALGSLTWAVVVIIAAFGLGILIFWYRQRR